MVLTCAAGYIGPGLFGLGAAALLAAGHAVGLLWALLALLALLLVQIRNWYGLWSVLVTGGVVFAATWWLPPEGQAAFAALATWFLLLAAPRAVLELQTRPPPAARAGLRRRPAGPAHPLPALVWVGVFLLVDVGALRPRRPLAADLSRGQCRGCAARGSQPIGWRTGSTCGAGGISSTRSSWSTVTCRPWWRMSSGSPSTSR